MIVLQRKVRLMLYLWKSVPEEGLVSISHRILSTFYIRVYTYHLQFI